MVRPPCCLGGLAALNHARSTVLWVEGGRDGSLGKWWIEEGGRGPVLPSSDSDQEFWLRLPCAKTGCHGDAAAGPWVADCGDLRRPGGSDDFNDGRGTHDRRSCHDGCHRSSRRCCRQASGFARAIAVPEPCHHVWWTAVSRGCVRPARRGASPVVPDRSSAR